MVEQEHTLRQYKKDATLPRKKDTATLEEEFGAQNGEIMNQKREKNTLSRFRISAFTSFLEVLDANSKRPIQVSLKIP